MKRDVAREEDEQKEIWSEFHPRVFGSLSPVISPVLAKRSVVEATWGAYPKLEWRLGGEVGHGGGGRGCCERDRGAEDLLYNEFQNRQRRSVPHLLVYVGSPIIHVRPCFGAHGLIEHRQSTKRSTLAAMATSTAESDIIYTIQTDTVVQPSGSNTDVGPSSITTAPEFPTAPGPASINTPDLTADYSGTCATPMMTGYRPFWASSGYDPYECGARAVLLDWQEYCCDGLMIDITQPLKGSSGGNSSEMCFENIRCCSADSQTTVGTVTSCTAGTEAKLIPDASVSSAFYATASTTGDAFGSDAFGIGSTTEDAFSSGDFGLGSTTSAIASPTNAAPSLHSASFTLVPLTALFLLITTLAT